MSKITLTGNPSGTGTFTIASPNSNSDRTVNLPDAGGDMVLTTATQTLTNKTFSGAQGFGTASLAEPTGTAPLYMARAWVNFNGTGTVAIRASGNVSSITDVGTGLFFINFATAMPDANYAVNGGGYYDNSPLNNAAQLVEDDRAGARTVNGVGVAGVDYSGSSFGDPLYASVLIHR